LNIAIIGWGYLIWDRRGLDVLPEWQPDGPRLAIEFARFADPPRILPVLVEGAPLQPTFWTLSQKRSMLAAAADLAVREGVGTHVIGQWSREESMRKPAGVEAVIAAWIETKGLDGAVWRNIPPNLPDRSPGFPSEEQRLSFLRDLVAAGRADDAKDYFDRMPAQIRTPFQERVWREFGWGTPPGMRPAQ
jgi:hypothetical protein